ncbi:MAG TPA: kynureninase [Burkholderiaceae bacterium]|nr:kynureninase [Burkholderiaceae bacterium]
MSTRPDCADLDASDPLAPHRAAFSLPDEVIYLVGNSLGALPRATPARMNEVIEREWGIGLVRSWNEARWTDLPQRVGAKIARLIGAAPHEVIAADSTSINLFKVLAAALHLQSARPRVSMTDRRLILSERTNFPTDLYVAEGLAGLLGDRYELKLVDGADIITSIDDTVAVVMLTHVNYRTGAKHALGPVTYRAHQAGALVVWDLAHSAGAVPVDLNGAGADFAVGCGYKYLNGGPGAPAFLYVAERHLQALAEAPFAQPLAGWFGHRAPFGFHAAYAPARSIERFTVGTPPILGLSALESGIDTVLAAGMEALRQKSVALTELFIRLAEERCADLGLTLISPRDASNRGSQVCFTHAHAWPVSQALIARGVIGDYRENVPDLPGILRFGFAPLYLRYVDAWDAVEALRDVLATRAYERPEYHARHVVT